jgi:PAS domain S-box-containing protein
LQSVGEGVYGLDCNGHTTFVNEVARKMLGWELSELITKPQHDIIHHTKPDGSHYEAKDCPIYAAFKDGKVHRIDDEIFWRKDGTSFPVEYISTPIKDESGKLLGAVVAFKDITLKKEAERTLQKSNADLQNALAEVERLKVRLEEENKYLQQEIKYSSNFEEIISKSKKFKHILTQIERVAPTSSTVLILGETGTGKELIARAIHNISKRRDRVLVKVNCAALPSSLIESELFGHEKGAFTGAIAKKIGRFELADRGTIFLDEIGEIPLELQPKLLRVLQEGEFERLGNSQTIKVDVRIIAATNIDLQEAVNNGEFREDLFYRLNVFPVNVIPLRERKEDIPLLANHFLLKLSTRIGKHINIITNKTMDELINYNWPGNIRELENIIERSVIITQGNKLNLSDSLSSSTIKFNNEEITTIEENEKNHILKALEFTNWKISGETGAAKLLGIKRTTLEARIKKLNIKRP